MEVITIDDSSDEEQVQDSNCNVISMSLPKHGDDSDAICVIIDDRAKSAVPTGYDLQTWHELPEWLRKELSTVPG